MLTYLFLFLVGYNLEFLVVSLILKQFTAKIYFVVFLVNLITYPIALYIYLNIFHNYLLVELSVVLIESIIYYYLIKIKFTKALYISFFANLISIILGVSYSFLR